MVSRLTRSWSSVPVGPVRVNQPAGALNLQLGTIQDSWHDILLPYIADGVVENWYRRYQSNDHPSAPVRLQ